jgi:hypothetical protein
MVTWRCNFAAAFSQTEGGLRGDVLPRSAKFHNFARTRCFLTRKALVLKTAKANPPNLIRVPSRLVVVYEGNYASHQHRLPQSW